MTPVIALLGRPNVGKSTLFNRLTRSRDALVADFPGVTRDRLLGAGRLGERPFWVIDTGGMLGEDPELSGKVSEQALAAADEADAVILVVDARAGLTADDHAIAATLRERGRHVWLAVNKAEHLNTELVRADFFELGLGEPWPISASHGHGVAELLDAVLADFPAADEAPAPAETDTRPVFAVVGRPNAGKSTLINRLAGEQRLIESPLPGTTRDCVRVPVTVDGRDCVLLDTAGLRRRAQVHAAIEKFSVIKTLQAIDQAQVVILVLDGTQGVTDQDAHIAGQVLQRGRGLVLAVNKSDTLDEAARGALRREIARRLPFVDFAPVEFISAKTGRGVQALMRAAFAVQQSAIARASTPELTRLLETIVAANPPPMVAGRRAKLRYAHQGGHVPPTIVIHGTQVANLPAHYLRYLENSFREALHLAGTPVRIVTKQGENPYAGRVNVLTPSQIERKRRARRRGRKLFKD
ncbi:ribosome biogenesis GTPase Der [Immundisolibacter sp.]|uniref:ribosome biogenesis GTPase Der n=1 Tax=Immundisolibacter sp. TaxID=1934948 RepID=UPI00260ECCBC|nr:ribosome biogenesis GTPase Der [Immundisolibacter sp.]MDD3651900.1 ribosome biogenesis GTPase Der [Immundisolibacter sp.]